MNPRIESRPARTPMACDVLDVMLRSFCVLLVALIAQRMWNAAMLEEAAAPYGTALEQAIALAPLPGIEDTGRSP